MAELDPTLAAALAQSRFVLFGAVEIALPGYTLRLLDGAGEVPIDGNVFVGRDPDWGVLDTIKGLSDSAGDSAAAPTIGLLPSGDLALAAMLDPALQGSPVRILVGVVDAASGLPAGAPYELFAGELDVATVRWDANDRRVEFSTLGIGDRLFAIEEGRRLSDAFHQTVWPGELGLGFVTEVENTVAWGQAVKSDATQIRSNLGGYGGGFGGGDFGGGLGRGVGWW